MKWEKVKLGELYEVHNGLSKAGKFFGEGYPFLTFSTVFNNYFIPKQITDLVQSTEKEQESYSIRRGDVFVTRTSETSDELGMSCVALKDYPMATYNGFTKRMRPITNRVFPEYIGYYMRLPSFRGEFRAFSTMTTRASLRNEDLLGLEVELPPIEIQKQIAGILSAYDDLIENNQRQIKLLEEAAQRLYKEWFVDLRFPGHENTKIVDGVPEGWRYEKLGALTQTTSGGTPSRRKSEYYVNGSIKWVKTKELNDGFIFETEESITEDAVKNSSAKILPGGTLMVAMYGATIGKIGITASEMACNQACCAFISYDGIISRGYLYCWLMENRNYLISQGKGAAQPNLSQEVIKNFSVLCPDKRTMNDFTRIVTAMLENKRVLENKILMLSKTRDDLLPKLMSGEVEV